MKQEKIKLKDYSEQAVFRITIPLREWETPNMGFFHQQREARAEYMRKKYPQYNYQFEGSYVEDKKRGVMIYTARFTNVFNFINPQPERKEKW